MQGQRIDDWSVMFCPKLAYLAPELHDHVHLVGLIDGKRKSTSRVVATNGRRVTTKSGSIYRLGRIRREYRQWIAEHGLKYDARQPVKVRP
jgi:hypothetical protein